MSRLVAVGRERHHRGTVLLTVTIIVFVIAAASAVTMKLALSNLQENEQSRKELQSRHIAESAVNVGVSRLNKKLLDAHELETLGNSSEVVLTESSADVPFDSLNVPEGGNMIANKATDGFDNDGDGAVDEADEPDETYTGGKYRIQIREWSDHNGVDDNRDGVKDDLGEASRRATSQSSSYNIEEETQSINPTHPFSVGVEVLGAVPDTTNPDSKHAGKYHAPVTAQVVIKRKGSSTTYEPWGPYDDPNAGNIHSHGNKEIKWAPDKVFPEDAKITFNFKSWERTNFSWTVENPEEADFTEENVDWEYDVLREESGDENPSDGDTPPENSNLDPARDSDPVPGYEGANQQEDPAEFMGKYITEADDGEGRELKLPSNNAIFMGELTHEAKMKENDEGEEECANCQSVSGVDFQDVVLDVDIKTFTNYTKVGHDEVDMGGRATRHKRRFTLDVTGAYGGYTTTLGTVVTASPQSKAKYGLFATGDLTLKSDVLVDSYNSNKNRSYLDQQTGELASVSGASYARANGNAGANGSITMDPGSTVMGQVDYGDSLHGHPNTYVHKEEESEELADNRTFESPEPPQKSTMPAGTLNVNGIREMGEGSLEFKSVSLKKDAKLTVPSENFVHITGSLEAGPDSKLVVKGPNKVRIDGDLTTQSGVEIVAVTEDGPVEFYIGDEVDIGPGSSIYSTTETGEESGTATIRTENFRWYVGDTHSNGSVRLRTSGKDIVTFQGILYGPSADMVFFPNAQVYGTVIGGNVTVRPNAGIHYDEALDKFCQILWDDCTYKAKVDSTWIKSTAGSVSR